MFFLNSHLTSEVHQNLEETCKINICVIFLPPFLFLYSINILKHMWNKGRYVFYENTCVFGHTYLKIEIHQNQEGNLRICSHFHTPPFFFVLLYCFNQVAFCRNLMELSVTI